MTLFRIRRRGTWRLRRCRSAHEAEIITSRSPERLLFVSSSLFLWIVPENYCAIQDNGRLRTQANSEDPPIRRAGVSFVSRAKQEISSFWGGFVDLGRDYLPPPITSLAMVANCMFDVPS